MVESAQLEDLEIGKKLSQCRYFKAKVLPHHQAGGINQTVKKSFDEKSIAPSDDSTSYMQIADYYVELHISKNPARGLPKKPCGGYILASVMPRRTSWGIITKSKASTYNATSMNLSTSSIEDISGENSSIGLLPQGLPDVINYG